jgi:predicted acylesterase/phospholipase RssA
MINDIHNICFEGGGIRSIAYMGSIKCLEDYHLLNNVRNYIGSSSGALTATMVAAGFNFDEIFDILYNKDYDDFRQNNSIFSTVKNLFKLFRYSGYYNNKDLGQFFDGLLEEKLGIKEITFKDFFKKTNNNLIITGTCIDKQTTEYFSKDVTPNMVVSLALRISTCIPYYYRPVKHNDLTYIDGGILNNFPITYFDTNDEINNHTLGIKFNRVDETFSFGNIKDFSFCFINILLDVIDKNNHLHTYHKNIIDIDVLNVKTTDFDIDKNTKNKLIQEGYNAALSFIQNKYPHNYKKHYISPNYLYANYLQTEEDAKKEIHKFVDNIFRNLEAKIIKQENDQFIKEMTDEIVDGVIEEIDHEKMINDVVNDAIKDSMKQNSGCSIM